MNKNLHMKITILKTLFLLGNGEDSVILKGINQAERYITDFEETMPCQNVIYQNKKILNGFAKEFIVELYDKIIVNNSSDNASNEATELFMKFIGKTTFIENINNMNEEE